MIGAKYLEMGSQRMHPDAKAVAHIVRNQIINIVIVFECWKNMRGIILIIRKQFKMNLVCNTVFNGKSNNAIEKKSNLKDSLLSENRLTQKQFNFCIHRPFQCRCRLLPLSHLCSNDSSCFLATHTLNMCVPERGSGGRDF